MSGRYDNHVAVKPYLERSAQMRNLIKINTPSRHDVDVAIDALQIEDEREKEALRRFYARERSAPIEVGNGTRLLVILGGSLLGWLLIWALIRLAFSLPYP